MTPYPTLQPKPTPTPLPEGYSTPKPTLDPQPAENASSKNTYVFHDDFESYANNIGEAPETDKLTAFGATVVTENDEYNNKSVTITNPASGTRYYATEDDTTTLITTKAVTDLKIRFNTLSAHSGTEAAMIDLTSSSADNERSDDSKLVIASRISVDASGELSIGDEKLGTIDTGKWYTIRTVTDVTSKTSDLYLYDGGELAGSVIGSPFYNAEATGIKNIRFNIKRGSGSFSVDDIYIYELQDGADTVFSDVPADKASLINYLAVLGIAKPYGTEINAVYNDDGSLRELFINSPAEDHEDTGTVRSFLWNSIEDMQPADKTRFEGDKPVTDHEVNRMVKLAAETDAGMSGSVTREAFYKTLIEVYKARSGDSEPVTCELQFDDLDLIGDIPSISSAVALGLTPVTGGLFESDRVVTRYEAAAAVSRLISAINVGITDKIMPEEEEDIVVPHVIDQLPEIDIIRDPMAMSAPDGYYYMCCTTGTSPYDDAEGEDAWKDNIGIRVWRSADLIDWETVMSAKEDSLYPNYIWNVYEGGTWEKINSFGVSNVNDGEQRFGQIVWAPEIHWIKGTYFIVYCMHPGGTAIARSVSGKPEGPYVRQESCQDTKFKNRIDPSLFWDDDNEVYYIDGACAIWHMNDDITGVARKSNGDEEYISAQSPAKEGGFLFKHNGIYYATAAGFNNGGYNAVITMNKTGKCLSKGAYTERHDLYTCGHNGYFEDKEGNWWATMFGNTSDPLANVVNGFNNGFALVPIRFDPYDGHVCVDEERLQKWTDQLQERGYSFSN